LIDFGFARVGQQADDDCDGRRTPRARSLVEPAIAADNQLDRRIISAARHQHEAPLATILKQAQRAQTASIAR
jgi:hypothetical protein